MIKDAYSMHISSSRQIGSHSPSNSMLSTFLHRLYESDFRGALLLLILDAAGKLH
jgi:hypothetical protein